MHSSPSSPPFLILTWCVLPSLRNSHWCSTINSTNNLHFAGVSTQVLSLFQDSTWVPLCRLLSRLTSLLRSALVSWSPLILLFLKWPWHIWRVWWLICVEYPQFRFVWCFILIRMRFCIFGKKTHVWFALAQPIILNGTWHQNVLLLVAFGLISWLTCCLLNLCTESYFFPLCT